MYRAMILLITALLINSFAQEKDSAYQEYKRQAAQLDKSIAQSYKDYFKHDSLVKAWNKKTEIPEQIAMIIKQDAIKDSIQTEQTRLALLSKYKIREVQEFFAQKEFHKNQLAYSY